MGNKKLLSNTPDKSTAIKSDYSLLLSANANKEKTMKYVTGGSINPKCEPTIISKEELKSMDLPTDEDQNGLIQHFSGLAINSGTTSCPDDTLATGNKISNSVKEFQEYDPLQANKNSDVNCEMKYWKTNHNSILLKDLDLHYNEKQNKAMQHFSDLTVKSNANCLANDTVDDSNKVPKNNKEVQEHVSWQPNKSSAICHYKFNCELKCQETNRNILLKNIDFHDSEDQNDLIKHFSNMTVNSNVGHSADDIFLHENNKISNSHGEFQERGPWSPDKSDVRHSPYNHKLKDWGKNHNILHLCGGSSFVEKSIIQSIGGVSEIRSSELPVNIEFSFPVSPESGYESSENSFSPYNNYNDLLQGTTETVESKNEDIFEKIAPQMPSIHDEQENFWDWEDIEEYIESESNELLSLKQNVNSRECRLSSQQSECQRLSEADHIFSLGENCSFSPLEHSENFKNLQLPLQQNDYHNMLEVKESIDIGECYQPLQQSTNFGVSHVTLQQSDHCRPTSLEQIVNVNAGKKSSNFEQRINVKNDHKSLQQSNCHKPLVIDHSVNLSDHHKDLPSNPNINSNNFHVTLEQNGCYAPLAIDQMKNPNGGPKSLPLEKMNKTKEMILIPKKSQNTQYVNRYRPILPKPPVNEEIPTKASSLKTDVNKPARKLLQGKLNQDIKNKYAKMIFHSLHNHEKPVIFIENEKYCRTNLHIAVMNRETEHAFCLVAIHQQMNADEGSKDVINLIDSENKTALDYAMLNNMLLLALYLLEAGARSSSTMVDGI